MSILPPWLVPVSQWILVQLITGLTVAFTPSSSPLRSLATGAVVFLAYIVQTTAGDFIETRFAGPVASTCWVNVLNAVDLLVLSQVSYDVQVEFLTGTTTGTEIDTGGEKKTTTGTGTGNTPTSINKLLWALSIPFNYRRINTPWQSPHTVLPSTVSRATFLLRSTLTLCLSVALVHVLVVPAADPVLGQAIQHLPRSSRTALTLPLTGESSPLLIQLLFTACFGAVMIASIVAQHALLAVLAVGSGLSEPASWPAIMGPVHAAYSLRRLWGITWHQILRKLLVSNADLAASCLGLSPGQTWFRLIFAFAASGVIHALLDSAFGISLGDSGAIWFFLVQVVGIALESGITRVIRSLGMGLGGGGGGWGGKVLGYVWVLAFLGWTAPMWTNMMLHALYADGQDIPSPFRVGGWTGYSV